MKCHLQPENALKMNDNFQYLQPNSLRQRLEVIKHLRSFYPNKKALSGTDRLQHLNRRYYWADVTMAILIWGLVLPALVNEVFNLHLGFFNWSKMPLLVIFSISISHRLSYGLYERFLLKQLIWLSHTDIEIPENNNRALLKVVEHINSRKRQIPLILLSAIILALGIWQLLVEETPYWSYTTVPVAVFFISWIIDLSNNLQTLKQNETDLKSAGRKTPV